VAGAIRHRRPPTPTTGRGAPLGLCFHRPPGRCPCAEGRHACVMADRTRHLLAKSNADQSSLRSCTSSYRSRSIFARRRRYLSLRASPASAIQSRPTRSVLDGASVAYRTGTRYLPRVDLKRGLGPPRAARYPRIGHPLTGRSTPPQQSQRGDF
jgi:hypothetical protein